MYQEFVASISRDIVYAIYHVEFTRPAAPVRQMQTNRGDGGGQPQPRAQQQDDRPQRSVLVRQRQEVQAVPYARPTRAARLRRPAAVRPRPLRQPAKQPGGEANRSREGNRADSRPPERPGFRRTLDTDQRHLGCELSVA